MATDVMIEANALTKRFGAVRALGQVGLHLLDRRARQGAFEIVGDQGDEDLTSQVAAVEVCGHGWSLTSERVVIRVAFADA
jgi:hypothetical protein